jgi:hypothetical protein
MYGRNFDDHGNVVEDPPPGHFDGPPVQLTRRGQLPDFPVEALPPVLAAMVAAVAEFTQTDPGMAGTSALTVLSACAGGRAEVEVRSGWREPLNLYTATVAAPGERKSAVQATMTRPLADAEMTLAEAGHITRLEKETEKEVARKAAEHAKAVAGRANDVDRDKLLAEAISAAGHAEAMLVPPVPRIMADDVTPEAVASLLAEQAGRLAVISAEGGIFDTIAGRYSNNVPQLDVWLKGHAGDPLRVDRKGRPPEFVRRPALTLGLMIQPSVLEAIARHETFRGRGLLARFLYAMPPSRVGRRRVGAESVPDTTAAAWDGLIRGLAETLAGWTDPAILTLDPAAHRLVLDIERHLEPQLGQGGDLGHIADWGSKLTGATVRLAGLLHLAADPVDGWRFPIGVAAVEQAVRIAGYYRGHALAAFDAMRADPLLGSAAYVLDVIRKLGNDTVSTRDLFAAVTRSRFPRAADLDPVLTVLDEHGYLSKLPEPERTGPGRRPSPTWAVHPAAIAAQSAVSAQSHLVGHSADSADSAVTSRGPSEAA